MSPEILGILLMIGIFAGAWNAIAGGASLFTFPALMATGLPPMVANATNYLALLPSGAAALPAYKDELRDAGWRLVPLLVISGLGAVVGSLLLTVSDPDMFREIVPFLLMIATALFAFGDRLRATLLQTLGHSRSRLLILATMFAFSVYGGYFGAGLGIILLGVVQVFGFEGYHAANGVKNLVATFFTILSVTIFGIGGLISWPAAIAMMTGSTIGGYLGGRLAKRVNTRWLRTGIICFGVILAAVYFQRIYLA
ncbi:sulfite exporter TauE/SafE family protein [Nisaea acidiphila]|uniref:Probable membrane transporter protein n=1 Tax=Nisaea acidiphila TaxID=1862145 RepID=A0A9J7ASR0_9PROT|nr:sulfite exporter TauE/SafE family protein [Nisaea acidiphila]UUX50376.1 sulfite exporter TauE/SafE family protein [Nisaea acidiphila]